MAQSHYLKKKLIQKTCLFCLNLITVLSYQLVPNSQNPVRYWFKSMLRKKKHFYILSIFSPLFITFIYQGRCLNADKKNNW